LVPVLAGLLALVAVMFWLRRWRAPAATTGRRKPPAPRTPAGSSVSSPPTTAGREAATALNPPEP
jgi:hypothetical protein